MVMNNISKRSCVSRGGGGGGGAASYKKKLKSLYILSKKCLDGHKNLDYLYLLSKYGPTPTTLMVSLLHK